MTVIKSIKDLMMNNSRVGNVIEINDIAKFCRDIMEVEGYPSLDEFIKSYHHKLIQRYGYNIYYEFLYICNMLDSVKIGKAPDKAEALFKLMKRKSMEAAEIMSFYPQFNDQYKMVLQCHMVDKGLTTLKDFQTNMISICGTPILSSKLITTSYVGGNFVDKQVYKSFYNNITGNKLNYKKWVGSEHETKRPNLKQYYSDTMRFNVSLSKIGDIPYVIDVIKSGISYNLIIRKPFINRSNMESLIDSLSDFKSRLLPTNLKKKFVDVVKTFTDDEKKDLDGYVFKLRSINKAGANTIARRNKEACVGYSTYKGL